MSDPRKKLGPKNFYVLGGLLVALGLIIGLGLSAGLDLQRTSSAQRSSVALSSSSTALPENPFAQVVEKALPAVVYVDVRRKVTGGSDDMQDELMRRFFGDDNTRRRPQRVPSSGSGFIIDAKGYVLTNSHVVRDAEDINVTLNDKRTFKATVVGSDPETDVAIIKIEGQRLPVVPLGDSDRIRVGDWAIAIGNPLGLLRGSVTVGVVSAQGRTDLSIFGGTPAFQDFIQTDASINFGNSGGPLCNIRGEAIGINTAINPSGQGIGFAIPINLARHVAEQLIAHGSVTRAWLGVQLEDLTPELAEGFGLDGTQGVLISSVIKDQPADRAGLRRNDVIVEYDGQAVSDRQKFRLKVADTPVGKKAPVVVLREGKRQTFYVTLGERSATTLASMEPGTRQGDTDLGGLAVRNLSDDEKSDASVSGGVMITDVQDGSPAEEAGLQPNMIVEEVAGRPVANEAAFRRLMRDARASGRPAVLLIHDSTGSRFIPLRLTD